MKPPTSQIEAEKLVGRRVRTTKGWAPKWEGRIATIISVDFDSLDSAAWAQFDLQFEDTQETATGSAPMFELETPPMTVNPRGAGVAGCLRKKADEEVLELFGKRVRFIATSQVRPEIRLNRTAIVLKVDVQPTFEWISVDVLLEDTLEKLFDVHPSWFELWPYSHLHELPYACGNRPYIDF